MNTLEKFSLHELLQVLVDGYDRTEPTQDFFEAEREIKRRYSDMVIRVEKAEAEVARLQGTVERLMRMVEDRFVLAGNSLDGHLQDCNCAVFLSSRMERDAWSELCYEWHGIYSDWQSANGHQAGKVSENEGSEG